MMIQQSRWRLLAAASLAQIALANEILTTSGFANCGGTSEITVENVDISYDNSDRNITFDIAGTNTVEQNVTAYLEVTAYGNLIFQQGFKPCDDATFIDQLCPLPEGPFNANSSLVIPSQFADMVPDIAFQIPDIAASAKLELKGQNDETVACIQSQVSNGKTVNIPAVPYIAAGIAGGALVVSGVSAVSSALAGGAAAGGSGGGVGTMSPSFMEVFGHLQGMAMNGMLSVNYPPVYRTFTTNFAFTTGLVSWPALQTAIDDIRASTGGNLTNNNYETLQNATLMFPDGTTTKPDAGLFARHAARALTFLLPRQEGGDETTPAGALTAGPVLTVSGIQAYAQQLSVPASNTFMTVLLIVSIIIASIVLSMVLVKVVLEGWALFGNFPENLTGFREHYWGSIARTITSLILLLYGVWVLYCVFQFTIGDSVLAQALAGVTLGLFTGILGFFSWKIWSTARTLKKFEGDTAGLYDDKKTWLKYSLFYDAYRKNYWWVFVPTIVYMMAKGIVIAAGDGHGMAQVAGQLIVEAIMLALLVWGRPYERKSGNVINIVIQVVRVLSVVCILIFIEELGVEQSTQTVTGVALIAVQSALTGILAILIIWNGINVCCKANPHRKRRKEREQLQREHDDLTPLDARNSLLLDRPGTGQSVFSIASYAKAEKEQARSNSPALYAVFVEEEDVRPQAQQPMSHYRRLTPEKPLLAPTASPDGRQPTLPQVGVAQTTGGYSYGAYGAAYRTPGEGYQPF